MEEFLAKQVESLVFVGKDSKAKAKEKDEKGKIDFGTCP
jgi:hypothetical protein